MPDEKANRKTAEQQKNNEPSNNSEVDGVSPELEGAKIGPRGGILEVELMPESDELQERRKKTKTSLKEMTNAVQPDSDPEELFSEDEGGFMDLLRESNLSPRHLKFCCGGVFGIILLAVGIWGLVQADLFSGDGTTREEVSEEDPEEDTEEYPDEDISIEDYESLDPSIYSGIFIGEELTEEDLSTRAGEDIGEELTSDDALAPYIEKFADMYRSMQVDVQGLLDASSDRQGTLDEYDQELNYLLYNGKQNLEQLLVESEWLAEKYAVAEAERDDYEARFFMRLKELDTYAAIAMLNDFVSYSEEVIGLRAQYKARQKLISYYEALIVNMEARIRDIELNEEALVKGVKVVDITGSDIDLIIDESAL